MIIVLKKRFRKVGFRFDALAAWLMCQQHGVDLNEMDKIPPDEYLASWVWSAHRSWSMFARKRDVYDYKGMKCYIERMQKSEWDKVIKAMSSSRAPESKKKAEAVNHGTTSLSQDGGPEYAKTIS